ncbi:MAG: helix-turn-helix domain-containing protein [Oxalobacter sp.]|nr:helix-turn-helix domain-containing protein [Oxalobacter sp.]
MKTQIIGGSTKITLTVPNHLAGDITAIIKNALNLANSKTVKDIDDDRLYSAKDLLKDVTPGDMLQGLRYREDLTQKQFAEKLGVKQHHISEMENNRRPISVQMAKKIQSIFGVGYKTFL